MAAAALLFWVGSTLATTQSDQPAVTMIDVDKVATIESYMNRLEPFGFHGAVLVAQGNEIFLNRAYGLADVSKGVPNKPGTLFSTGSVTKQFTATAILYLQANNNLNVNDPITNFFDDVPEDKKQITIHQLLTHTAGLRPAYGSDEDPITRPQLIRLILDTPLELPPGDKYQYSNGGYSLLAAIVEIVTGVEYEKYLRDTFFLPLDMNATGLKLLDIEPAQVSRSHNLDTAYASPLERPTEYWFLKGNGGILSTTTDMYKWYRGIRTGDVLPKDARDQMFTPYVLEYEDGGSYYGYGWVIDEYKDGKTLIWHNGGSMPQGWGCAVYHFVDDDLFIVVFSNKPIEGIHPTDIIAERLAGILIGSGTPLPPSIDKDSVSGFDIASHAGAYSLPNGDIFRVTAPTGVLLIDPEGQTAMAALFPSRFEAQLSKYNQLTRELVTALSASDFDKALGHFDTGMATKREWEAMVKEWWGSLKGFGPFERVEIVGTLAAEGAQTHCRIHFSGKSFECRFLWMGGKCGGIRPNAEPPSRELLGQSPNRFVSYSLTTGAVVAANFAAGDRLVIEHGDARIEATREAQ